MMGSQASLVLKEAITFWREPLGELRKERELEGLREELLQFRIGKQESAKTNALDADGLAGRARAHGDLRG